MMRAVRSFPEGMKAGKSSWDKTAGIKQPGQSDRDKAAGTKQLG
ncbi:hypothetical protein CLS_36740 [[Clostridium] cf. saccharolyticum K10]|nr:hypothetical protein CLS_36740 [[Clostridium] cf. saccharolyticum K10]